MSKCLLPNTKVNQFSNFRARARRHIKPKGSFMKKEVKLFDFLQTFLFTFIFVQNYSMGPTTGIKITEPPPPPSHIIKFAK